MYEYLSSQQFFVNFCLFRKEKRLQHFSNTSFCFVFRTIKMFYCRWPKFFPSFANCLLSFHTALQTISISSACISWIFKLIKTLFFVAVVQHNRLPFVGNLVCNFTCDHGLECLGESSAFKCTQKSVKKWHSQQDFHWHSS